MESLSSKYELFSHEEFQDILTHKSFIQMDKLNHHGGISCLSHTLDVAEMTYQTSKRKKMDTISATRGALLHDFYLYDWHTDSPGLHGVKHPYIAMRNAEKHFDLNPIEKDAILRHMWPLAPFPPKYKESFLVSLVDKYITARDYSQSLGHQTWSPFHYQPIRSSYNPRMKRCS